MRGMWLSDQYKAAFEWRSDRGDVEPHYGLVFLVLLPIGAGVVSVAWLGWSWRALLLTGLLTALFGGLAVRRWLKASRRELEKVPEWRR